MVGLDRCVVVHEDDLHEPPVCAIDYGRCGPRGPFNRPCGEVERVYTLLIELVGQPYWSCGRHKGEAVQCGSSLAIYDNRGLIPQDINVGHIDRSILERSLRVGAGSAGAHIPSEIFVAGERRSRRRIRGKACYFEQIRGEGTGNQETVTGFIRNELLRGQAWITTRRTRINHAEEYYVVEETGEQCYRSGIRT